MMRMLYRASLPCMHHTAPRQRVYRAASSLGSSKETLQTVLFERPASHEARAAELRDWIDRQRSALPALAAELEKTKDGPNAEDLEVMVLDKHEWTEFAKCHATPCTSQRPQVGPLLQMELGWLLDDAIDSVRGPAGSTMHSKKMQQVLRADSVTAQDMTVSMRIDLEGLDCLWQQRTRERCNTLLCAAHVHNLL